jgi:hypothetical protein
MPEAWPVGDLLRGCWLAGHLKSRRKSHFCELRSPISGENIEKASKPTACNRLRPDQPCTWQSFLRN